MPSSEAPGELAGRAVLEAARTVGLGIAIVEIGGSPPAPRMIFVNEALAELVGRTVDDTLAQPPFDLLVPEDRPRLRATLEARLRGEAPSPRTECELETKSGGRVPIELGVHLYEDGGRTLEVLLVRDLRDRRAAAASERRFRALVESAPDGIVISRRGVVVYANAAGARILGLEPSALVGHALAEYLVPEDAERMRARMMALAQGATLLPSEYRARHADGRTVVAEIASIPIEHEGAPAVLAFARDVTERVAMQAELARTDRLAALGRLSAGMAHEINNPLGFASLSAEALDRRIRAALPDGEERRTILELVDHVRRGTDRVAGIVRDLKAFSRDAPSSAGRVDLRAVLESAIRMVAHELAPRANLEKALPSLPAVVGEAGRLEQVFVNLLVNAAQALPEGTRGTVAVRARVEEAAVIVEVADTGVGIEPALVERVFDPFFTTKKTGEGMGLGLSICHGIVRAFGGDIDLRSVVGRGTTVSVRLPIAGADAAGHVVPASTDGPGPARRARILVVEDTQSFAAMIRQILAPTHDVTTTPGVGDALAALAREGARFDVVLCDMTLGDGTGVDVYEQAIAREPALAGRFVFMTGGAFTPRVTEFLERTAQPRLDKPFTIASLESAVASVAR